MFSISATLLKFLFSFQVKHTFSYLSQNFESHTVKIFLVCLTEDLINFKKLKKLYVFYMWKLYVIFEVKKLYVVSKFSYLTLNVRIEEPTIPWPAIFCFVVRLKMIRATWTGSCAECVNEIRNRAARKKKKKEGRKKKGNQSRW